LHEREFSADAFAFAQMGQTYVELLKKIKRRSMINQTPTSNLRLKLNFMSFMGSFTHPKIADRVASLEYGSNRPLKEVHKKALLIASFAIFVIATGFILLLTILFNSTGLIPREITNFVSNLNVSMKWVPWFVCCIGIIAIAQASHEVIQKYTFKWLCIFAAFYSIYLIICPILAATLFINFSGLIDLANDPNWNRLSPQGYFFPDIGMTAVLLLSACIYAIVTGAFMNFISRYSIVEKLNFIALLIVSASVFAILTLPILWLFNFLSV
jgi:hypothetical protein